MNKYEMDYLVGRLDNIEMAITTLVIAISAEFQSLSHMATIPHTLSVEAATLKTEFAVNYLDGKLLTNGETFDKSTLNDDRVKLLHNYLPSEIIHCGCTVGSLTVEHLSTLEGYESHKRGKVVDHTFILPSGSLTIQKSDSETRIISAVKVVCEGGVETVSVPNVVAFTEDELFTWLKGVYTSTGLTFPTKVTVSEITDLLAESKLSEFCHVNLPILYDLIQTADLKPGTVGGLSMLSKVSHINGVILQFTHGGVTCRYNIGNGLFSVGQSMWPESVDWERLPVGVQWYIKEELLKFAMLLWSHLNRCKEAA